MNTPSYKNHNDSARSDESITLNDDTAPLVLKQTNNIETQMRFMYNLRAKGVTDKRVLEAMEKVDRGCFVKGHFSQHAYEDTPLPIRCGQTISQPTIVGIMTKALNVEPRDKVLEIGTGSGYQAAILSYLGRRIYTIERHRPLVNDAQAIFKKLNITNITTFTGDGGLGLPDHAPFDRIIITAAAEDLPSPLLSQLKVGGVMVLPVGQSNTVQTLLRVSKTQTGLEYEELCNVRFVPLIEGIAEN